MSTSMRVFKDKITKCIFLNKYQHPFSLSSVGDGVSAVYGTYWPLQPLRHLFYFLSHIGIYFCWAHSLLIMFLSCYFLLCSKWSYIYIYNTWLLYSLESVWECKISWLWFLFTLCQVLHHLDILLYYLPITLKSPIQHFCC